MPYRCGTHGLWFDGAEVRLPQLAAAARQQAAREHRDVRAEEIERLLNGVLRNHEDITRELVTRLLAVEDRNRQLEEALAETRAQLGELRARRSSV